jgi:hypothetical protein
MTPNPPTPLLDATLPDVAAAQSIEFRFNV